MHDPKERPQFRWRMLAWGIAVLILLPVLYVAADGPLLWWAVWHPGKAGWFEKYEQTLDPLRTSASVDEWFESYRAWWISREPPRSWRRGSMVWRIERLKAELAAMPARIRAAEEEEQAREKTLRAIKALEDRAIQAEVAALMEERPVPEQAELRKEIERLVKSLPPPPSFMEACSPTTFRAEESKLRAELLDAKAILQHFDAQ